MHTSDVGPRTLPCPVCLEPVHTEGKGHIRVYASHERAEQPLAGSIQGAHHAELGT